MKIQRSVHHRYLHRLSSDNSFQFGYVPISKNASTYLTEVLRKNLNWQLSYNYNYHKCRQYLVCLRDPLERWYSGVAEYFFRFHKELISKTPDDDLLTLVFERVYLDEHTMPQVDFLTGLNTEDITFFEFGDSLSENFKDFLVKNNLTQNINLESTLTSRHYNSTSSSELKKHWIRILKSNMTPELQNHIQQFYHMDYNLINNVEFYGSN